MAKKVVLEITDNEAGDISLALQGLQMDVGENGDGLRSYRIGNLLDKINTARSKAAQ